MKLKSPASTTGSSGRASSSRCSTAFSTCSCAGLAEWTGVQVCEHERSRAGTLDAHDLADPPLAGARPEQPAAVEHEHAPLLHDELVAEQDRVRLAGEERAEEPGLSEVTAGRAAAAGAGGGATPATRPAPFL